MISPRSLSLLAPLALLACTGTKDGKKGDDSVVITYSDQDEDTILDIHEGYSVVDSGDTGEPVVEERDSEGDGIPDYLDIDSDDDGIPDENEAGDTDPLTLPFDNDEDGTPDYLDTDSDDNCILDANEGLSDLDGDGTPAYSDLDDDGDGILDRIEIGSACELLDSDGDGTADYLDLDSDGDGIADVWEAGTSAWETEPRDTDGDGTADYLDQDSDGDGYPDRMEAGSIKMPAEPNDTDGDGLYDFQDDDSDGDGLLDAAERDTYGTDPYSADSDSDGFSDGAEVSAGTSPTDAGSVIEGVYVTVPERTLVEEDFEFTLSVKMGDVAFLLDSTGSMSSTLSGVASEFATLVTELSREIPDAEYGVATYDDYAYGSYGYSSSGDKPFELRQEVTSNTSQVQTVLRSLGTHYGGDGPESGMEALYQGLTGIGYDQNCGRTYNSDTDVKPFIASSSDPFGGGGGQFRTGSYAGGGTRGGFGFREYALPVIVYVTDNYLRDPESGYGAPGGCPGDAGRSDVIAAANDLGAYLIGISASGSTPVSQMNDLADNTNSFADTDGDGRANDRLVFTWTGSSTTLRTTIVDAIKDLVSSIQFDRVSLAVENDPYGFVTGITPAYYEMSSSADGETVEFQLDFRGAVAQGEEDEVYTLTLNIFGDDTVLLDTLDIFVVVPGRSY